MAGDVPRIAIILPAYNEELTLRDTMLEFHAVLPHAAIYVVDNNSTDATAAIAAETLGQLDCTGALISEPRQGKGFAVRRAFIDVDADIYVLADADLTYPAQSAPAMIDAVRSNAADMVVGDRHSEGHYQRENQRPLHNFGNRLVQSLVNRLFGSRLVDIMSGYRVCSRQFVKNYPILVSGFQLETDMTLHALQTRFRILDPRPGSVREYGVG